MKPPTDAPRRCQLRVKVVPGASRTRLSGWLGEEMKVTVAAAPERGKANAAVVELLSQILQLPKGAVQVTAGLTSPHKIVSIEGINLAEVHTRIEAVLIK